jgi:hypothetical protein
MYRQPPHGAMTAALTPPPHSQIGESHQSYVPNRRTAVDHSQGGQINQGGVSARCERGYAVEDEVLQPRPPVVERELRLTERLGAVIKARGERWRVRCDRDRAVPLWYVGH